MSAAVPPQRNEEAVADVSTVPLLLRDGPQPPVRRKHAAGAPARWMLPVELAAVAGAMALAAWLTGATPWLAVGVGAVVCFVTYIPGRDTIRPGLPTVERVIRDMAIPFSAAGIAGAFGWLAQPDLASALAVTAAGGGTTLIAASLRHVLVVRVRVVVVGSASSVAEAFTWWHADPRVELVGTMIVDDERPRVPAQAAGPGARATAPDARAMLTRSAPDMVVVVPGPGVDPGCVRRIGWALEGTGIGLAVQSQLEGVAAHRIQHTSFAGVTVMQVRSSRPPVLVRAMKAAVDRLAAFALLVVLAPVLAVLMVLVRATSEGPAIFRQVRIGKQGVPFTMYKLRSMVANAEEERAALLDVDEGNGLLFKKRADPRVTPVGKVLRKYSLDELPQLVNVLKGDMSLVGPRPALAEEVARYTPLERRRLAVRPGLTGPWQVSGRSTLARDESMRLDIEYADNFRLVDDAVIALRTVDAVIHPKGAW